MSCSIAVFGCTPPPPPPHTLLWGISSGGKPSQCFSWQADEMKMQNILRIIRITCRPLMLHCLRYRCRSGRLDPSPWLLVSNCHQFKSIAWSSTLTQRRWWNSVAWNSVRKCIIILYKAAGFRYVLNYRGIYLRKQFCHSAHVKESFD